MSTLSQCIRKAGKALNQSDADAIKAARDDLRADGLDPQQAAIEAVASHIQSLLEEHAAITTNPDYRPILAAYDAHIAPAAEAPVEVSAPKPTKTESKLDDIDAEIEAAAAELAALLKPKPGTLNTGVDPQVLIVGAKLGALYIQKGVVKFGAWANAIIDKLRAMGVDPKSIKPHLKGMYAATQQNVSDELADQMDDYRTVRAFNLDAKLNEQESDNAEREPVGTQRDSGDRQNEAPKSEIDIPDGGRGRGGQSADEAGAETGSADGEPGSPMDMFGPANAGKRSDQPIYSEKSRLETGAARDTDNPRSRPDSTGGLFAERDTDQQVDNLLEKTPAVIPAAQRTLEKHSPSDVEQIKAQMPFLTDGQAEDVAFAEARFSKPDGFGVLFTNGTGTGKTFTGLGIVKRLHNQGKKRILIAVPKQPIADAWVKAGKNFFGLDISRLDGIDDAGEGIVVTTFANLGQNNALINEDWDAFVMDEAHYLTSNQAGSDTKPLDMLRALGVKRGTAYAVVAAKFPKLDPRRAELRELIKHYRNPSDDRDFAKLPALEKELDALDEMHKLELEKAKARISETKDADKPRAIFLSATPFAYEKNVQWANEWLFDWGYDDGSAGLSYNSGGNYEKFMMTHFGYRMRYNKLTEPDAKVDRGLMQRTFNTWLKKEGVLSARALDSDFDYDRRFVMADSAIGRRVDDALQWLSDNSGGDDGIPGMSDVQGTIRENFDYQSRMYFLEAIKAKESIGHIKAHLALGRKVMVVTDFVKGGAVNPFLHSFGDPEAKAAYDKFASEFSDLIQAFSFLPSPIEQMQKHFPDALVYNGKVTPKNRIKMQDDFNSDAPGSPRLMIAQSDAMREGVSIHDTSGKHQRVEINLGMPSKPTAAIQLEGRIYRTGQASDAMFRYFTIGTSWERHAFASKIAGRASAAENLAMGEQARGLKESFINAYEEADTYEPGYAGEGTGGKEADKAFAGSLTRWDMAKSFYFGTKKQGSGRGAKGREHSEYFATPEPLGLKMVEWADIRGGEHALEPSAGHGAIGRWFPENSENRAIEFTNELSSKLSLHFDGKVETGDFMQHNIVNKYDAIVMNPPFGAGGADARNHVAKAMKHLRDGGRIVALIPTGPAADAKFEKLLESEDAKDFYTAAEIQLPAVTFERAGTAVRTRVLVLEKQTNKELIGKIQQQNRDYSDVEDIAGLFDSLENSEIRPRVKPVVETADELLESAKQLTGAAAPSAEQTGGMETWEAKHSQTGADLYMAKANARVEKDGFKDMAAVAKKHGGYWSRFGKAGFLFKTEAERKAFLDALSYTDGGNGYNDASDIQGGWFRATSQKAGNVTVADVQTVADKVGKSWGIDVEIIQSADDLPPSAQHQMRIQGITGGITGYYDRRTKAIYLVADAMRNKKDAQVTLLHEAVGHLGIETVMGSEINEFLRSVYDARGADPWTGKADPVIKAAWEYVNQEKTYGNAKPIVKAAEMVARIAESDPKHTLVQRFIQMVRQALRKMGFPIPFNSNDIIEALRRAKRALEDGSYAGEGSEGGLFQAAYHGSPHRFEKFSNDAMGTGEGSQAFGWGSYFAQKKDVAEHYRQLAGVNFVGADSVGKWAVFHSSTNGETKVSESFDSSREANDALAAMEKPGAMYAVDVPEDHELLDWDVPFVDQPPGVKKALSQVLKDIPEDLMDEYLERKNLDWEELYGHDIYSILERAAMDDALPETPEMFERAMRPDEVASKYLKSLGIPGLRFYDHMSRFQPPPVPAFEAWAGYNKGVDLDEASEAEKAELRAEYDEYANAEDTRTRNFVIFDDERIEITDKLFRVDDEAAPQKLTEKQFYSQYRAHKDIRNNGANMAQIMRDGWKPGIGVTALPPYRGGEPTNVVEKAYAPRKGDVYYLVPKGAWTDGARGLRINAGWKPEPYEVVTIERDNEPLYEAYSRAIEAQRSAGGNFRVTDQTESPEFQRWFGDSKVVDENGDPLVVYHGTGKDLSVLEGGHGMRKGIHSEGIWFTSNPDSASEYAEYSPGQQRNVMPVYLSIQNPKMAGWEDFALDSIADYKAQGYDGAYDMYTGAWVAFDSSQIKSATGNNGDFDAGNPDILHSRMDTSRRDFLKTASSIAVGAALPRGLRAAPKAGKAIPLSEAVANTPLSNAVLSLLEANDLKGALSQLAQDGPKEIRVLARIVSRLIPETGFDVVIDSADQYADHGSVTQNEDGGATLTLHTGGDATGADVGTFLHESLHAAVMARYSSLNRGLKNNYRILGLDDAAARDAMDQFTGLWNEFRRSFKDSTIFEVQEALANPDEFFVRALTDPIVQKALAEKEYDGRTLMERFKDWVKYSLFGFKKDGTIPSWLDAALMGADDFIKAMGKDAPDFKFADSMMNKIKEQNSQREVMRSRRNRNTGQASNTGGVSYSYTQGGQPSTGNRATAGQGAGGIPPRAPIFQGADDSREELNRRMREEHHGIWWKAKMATRRYLAPGGLLPKLVFDAKVVRDSKMGAAEMDVQYHVAALEYAFKKDFGKPFDQRTADQARMMRDALAGNPSANLPEATAVALEAMRQYIDRYSAAYVDVLRGDALRLLSELSPERRAAIQAQLNSGVLDDIRGREAQIVQKLILMGTITDNIGEYVHRSYRAFDDPHWARNVPDAVLNNARDYLESRHLEENAGATDAEAAAAADRVIESILKENTAFDNLESFIRESKLGAKDLSLLKKRKQIAPEIRALMGEYDDPRLNFAKSATKMTRLIFNDTFLKRVREVGMGVFLFEDGEQPAGHWKSIAGDSNESFAPLNGLKTTPEINQAFVDALGNENMADWYRAIIQINGAVKFGKTVLSPTTAARNFMSAMFFTMGNGHFNLAHAAKSLRVHLNKKGANYDYLRHLKELGVVYDTPYAEEMMRLLRDTDLQDRLMGVSMKAKHALDLAQSFYRFGDDFWKVIGFENEVAIQMKHYGLGRPEAEKAAAERIRNTYPTYSMTGKFVNQLRRFPLAGTFVSFPSEIIRTSYHILRYAKQDMQRSKALGARRVVGLAIISGLAYAAQILSMMLLGVDDDEDEAVRQQLPEWSRNSNLYYMAREDGNLRYLDLSFLDPYNYWKRPITAIMRDEPLKKSAVEAAREMLAPFFGTDIAFGALAEIWSNQKSGGGEVYSESDTAVEQAASIANHIRKAVQPGAFSNMERIIKAARGERSTTGHTYTLEDEMAALVGFRASTLDPAVSLKYRSYEIQDSLRDATGILSKSARDPNPVSDKELREVFDRVSGIRDEAYGDLLNSIKAAEKSGLSQSDVRKQLQAGGFAKKDAFALSRGQIPVKIPTNQYLKSAIDSAESTFGLDVKNEIVRRRKLIMEWQREQLRHQRSKAQK